MKKQNSGSIIIFGIVFLLILTGFYFGYKKGLFSPTKEPAIKTLIPAPVVIPASDITPAPKPTVVAPKKTSTTTTVKKTTAPVVKVTTPPAPTAPLPPPLPKIVSATATNPGTSTIIITWKTNVPTVGQILYGEQSSLTGTYPLSTNQENVLSTDHTYTFSDLIPEKKYYYKIYVTDASGNKTNSSENSFVPALATISGVKTDNISATGATISWTTNFKTKGQVVYSTESSSTGVYSFSTPLTNTFETSHSVDLSNLTYNTKYYYRVIFVDAAGIKVSSQEYSFSSSIIYNVSYSKSYSGISGVIISWSTSVPTKTEIRYGTQRSTAGIYPFSATDSSLLMYHNMTLYNLDINATYYYRIITTDANNKKTTSVEYSFNA
ncbi:MAG: fibronectin type III domain-containing protein [Patescibacteria group bacterium]